MLARARVFITRDYVLDPVLDTVARALREQGHLVTRGPPAAPGRKTPLGDGGAHPGLLDADVLVTSARVEMDDALLDRAARLRGVVFPSIGTEALDIAEAGRRGLLVANGATPENFQSMAEATVMLMLELSYGLRRSTALMAAGTPRPATMHATMLRGKTVGLVGLGRIARGVAQRLRGWDVRLLACNPGMAAADGPGDIELVELDTLLAASDIVSLHTTLTATSRHLIGRAQLARMKPGAYLINTARGGCVDEAALAEALRERRIAGAALDAFAVEPLPADSPLRTLDNVLLTPHMVGHTRELFDSFAPACVRNVVHLLRGEPPPLLCNPQAIDAWRQRLDRLDGTGR